jgi:hypothetical protein
MPPAVSDILDELAARATVEAYKQNGAMPVALLEAAADGLRWHAAEALRRGYDREAALLGVLADRLEDTADLARLLARNDAA